MIALGKEKLKYRPAVLLEPLRVGAHVHAFKDGGHAGRQQLVAALDLYQAKPAGAHIAQALHMAEGGDVNVVLLCHFQNGLPSACADLLTVDL